MCMCPMSYNSDLCEINVDDCIDNPCVSNGSCVDGSTAMHVCVHLGMLVKTVVLLSMIVTRVHV